MLGSGEFASVTSRESESTLSIESPRRDQARVAVVIASRRRESPNPAFAGARIPGMWEDKNHGE
jgi:hypothetical protein